MAHGGSHEAEQGPRAHAASCALSSSGHAAGCPPLGPGVQSPADGRLPPLWGHESRVLRGRQNVPEQRRCSRCSTRARSLTPWHRRLPARPVLLCPHLGTWEPRVTSPAASGSYLELRGTGAVPPLPEEGVSLPGGLQAPGSGAPALGVSGRAWCGAQQSPAATSAHTPAASSDGDHEPPHLAGRRLPPCPPPSVLLRSRGSEAIWLKVC